MRHMPLVPVVPMVLLGAIGSARAADVPITGLRLIVMDKTVAASKAKAVFVAKDAAITKGTGVDLADIEATLDIAYDSVSGAFTMPQGANWLVNSASVGKYVNKVAPTGGAVKVSVIKPGSLVKVVGKSLGDTPIDISSAPSGPVYVVDAIVNGGDEMRLCTVFTGCVHKLIAGGTGYKLVCKGSSGGDPACLAVAPCLANRFVDQGSTVLDTCTNLQWERKTTAVGSGENAMDPHDVDNTYAWAGICSLTTSKLCQPNLAAETACKLQTAMSQWSDGCEQCGGGEGTCTMSSPSAITTLWDWLSQVNAANYEGYNDWRLPSESGCNACYTGAPTYSCTGCGTHELESLLLSLAPCETSPCIESILGPTQSFNYWSATTDATDPGLGWRVHFGSGGVGTFAKAARFYVRAVRGGS